MIGRAAQGRPWLFREIAHFLTHGEPIDPPQPAEIRAVLRAHVQELHAFYGEFTGVRVARKHVSWYTHSLAAGAPFRHAFNALESARDQLQALDAYFDRLASAGDTSAHEAGEEELAA
jgi:tRNA-dihydrouridine synthase B